MLNAVSHLGSSIGSKVPFIAPLSEVEVLNPTLDSQVTQRVPMEKRLLKSAVAQKKEEELLAD